MYCSSFQHFLVAVSQVFVINQVWAPGSPFDPTNAFVRTATDSDLETDALAIQSVNGTAAGNLYAAEVRNGLEMEVEKEVKEESKIAVILLLVGIISFRSFN